MSTPRGHGRSTQSGTGEAVAATADLAPAPEYEPRAIEAHAGPATRGRTDHSAQRQVDRVAMVERIKAAIGPDASARFFLTVDPR